MLFHSSTYAWLLLASLLGCWLCPQRLRWIVLLLGSGAFYVAWRPEYLLLLLVTATSCHYGAWAVHRARAPGSRRALLGLVIAFNLGILFLFKYWGLFARSWNAVAGGQLSTDLGFLLPVGISFYTFQAIGYVVDVARGQFTPERNLGRTTLFVAFFPQLVAGPIERARHLLPALAGPIRIRYRNLRLGAWLFLWGLFKKVVIADRLGLLVDPVYGDPEAASGWLLLAATYAFAFQIYCDFSGYTDMAIGSARMFGIDLMQNFRVPYLAGSLREFWSRWHISLSTWFRDYLYIPLGGSRGTHLRWAFNILIVFVVSGLWHGAQWTFIVWGLLHGLIVLIEASIIRRTRNQHAQVQPSQWSFTRAARILLTFHIVLLSWVFFRAADLETAWLVLTRITQGAAMPGFVWPGDFNRFEAAIALAGIAWMCLVECPLEGHVGRVLGCRPRWKARLIVLGTLLAVLNFGIFSHPTQFVYFQF